MLLFSKQQALQRTRRAKETQLYTTRNATDEVREKEMSLLAPEIHKLGKVGGLHLHKPFLL